MAVMEGLEADAFLLALTKQVTSAGGQVLVEKRITSFDEAFLRGFSTDGIWPSPFRNARTNFPC
jgi:hypothetical protein